MNRENINETLRALGLSEDEYSEAFSAHTKRMVDTVAAPQGGDTGDSVRIHAYSEVLSQSYLHRSLKLIEGAAIALTCANTYSLALTIRAHYETTAAIGYLHYKLSTCIQGNITNEALDIEITKLLLGTRDKSTLSNPKYADLGSRNILSMLEYADKTSKKHVFDGDSDYNQVLLDSYEFLSEFCHPNLASNTLSFVLDRKEGVFRFQSGGTLRKMEIDLFDYIHISNPIFLELFDKIQNIAKEI